MTASVLQDWLVGSFAVGAIATAFVSLCPVSGRVCVRQAVPVVAFGLLLG
jgi:hypothetical protein